MKKYLYLSMAAIAALLSFASCGGDDDDDEIVPNDQDNPEVIIDKAKFTETANQMVLSYTINVLREKVPVKHTATFQGDECSSFITEYTYSKESYAKEAYEDAIENKEDGDETVYSYKGKVYTEDETAYYKGQSKNEVRQYLKFLEAAVNK